MTIVHSAFLLTTDANEMLKFIAFIYNNNKKEEGLHKKNEMRAEES
jgi:hypothetical protein